MTVSVVSSNVCHQLQSEDKPELPYISWQIGRTTSEEVVLKLVSSKCIPIQLYGLESLSLYKYQLNSLDFTINRFFMKLFKTTDMPTDAIATLQEKEIFSFAFGLLAY